MSYQKSVREHFVKNKERFFPGIGSGKWRKSGTDYPHILPKEYEALNLLFPYRDSLQQYLETNKGCLKPHIYFHHLNSSQAMCLNFFYPLVKEKKLDLILEFIGIENEAINYEKTCFEKKSPIEKGNYRPTYFDFYIKTNSGKEIFFEIKFTEQKFGECKADDIHKNKFDFVYKDKLGVLNKEYHQPALFFKNYQILRNLVCISENSYVVFLYPEKNEKIRIQAESAKTHILKNEVCDNLINLTWESLLDYVEKKVGNQKLEEQFNDFRDKYNL